MFSSIFFSVLNQISHYMPLAINIMSRFFLALIAFGIIAYPQSFEMREEVRPRIVKAPSAAPELEKKAFELLNRERATRGLAELSWNEGLVKVARLHSGNMAKYNFFSHRGLDGMMVDDRADSLGIRRWKGIGENIAYNRGFKNPVEFTVEQWMLSNSHRNNLLSSKWTESAVGIIVDSDQTYYFTQVFLYK